MVSKSPFTSGILGFCEFCFCSFVTHLKTIPFPFKSTRGRCDSCFGPAPGLRDLITKLRVQKEESLTQSLPFMGGRWKKTLFKVSLRSSVDKGSSYLFVLLTSYQFPGLDAIFPFHGLGNQGPQYWKDVPWATWVSSGGLRTLSPHPHSFLWSFSTGLQQAASVSEGLLLSWEDNLHTSWLGQNLNPYSIKSRVVAELHG